MNAPPSYHFQRFCFQASGYKLGQCNLLPKSTICKSCDCFTRAGFVPCVYKGLCHQSQSLTLLLCMVIKSFGNQWPILKLIPNSQKKTSVLFRGETLIRALVAKIHTASTLLLHRLFKHHNRRQEFIWPAACGKDLKFEM